MQIAVDHAIELSQEPEAAMLARRSGERAGLHPLEHAGTKRFQPLMFANPHPIDSDEGNICRSGEPSEDDAIVVLVPARVNCFVSAVGVNASSCSPSSLRSSTVLNSRGLRCCLGSEEPTSLSLGTGISPVITASPPSSKSVRANSAREALLAFRCCWAITSCISAAHVTARFSGCCIDFAARHRRSLLLERCSRAAAAGSARCCCRVATGRMFPRPLQWLPMTSAVRWYLNTIAAVQLCQTRTVAAGCC
jgi:hypothetical protein